MVLIRIFNQTGDERGVIVEAVVLGVDVRELDLHQVLDHLV